MSRPSYFIIDIANDSQPRLLTTTPLDYNSATNAVEKLIAAEKVLPEQMRRKYAKIDLEELLPKTEG